MIFGAHSSPRMPARPLAIVVLCALVLASGIAGVALDRIVLRPVPSSTILGDSGFHPLSTALRSPTAEDRRRIRGELSRELSLTPAQDSALDAIMTQRAVEFSALREEIRPRVEQLVADVRSDLEQVLTPVQRERFRRLQRRGDDAQRMSSAP